MSFEAYQTSSPAKAATPDDRPYDGWEYLLTVIKKSFNESIENHEVLFTTDCGDLFDIFLENLPKETRQHYNCNTCRNFVNRYGGLVTIDKDGCICPVMWSSGNVWPAFFYKSISAMVNVINDSRVNGMFVTSEKRLGMPKTGVWTHMSVDIPKWMIYKNALKTADQEAAEKKEEFKMLMSAVNKYTIDTIETAVNMLRSETLSRSGKFLRNAMWFRDLKSDLKNKQGSRYSNLVWKAAVTAPTGYCHISSSMLGTLLDDIQEGFDFESIKQRFNEKMSPLQYQRPQVAPGAGNVKRAEEIVAKLGLADSLKRRFARFDEIKKIWVPQQKNPSMTAEGVFAGIKTKDTLLKNYCHDNVTYASTMTWEKFQRTVLPTAKKIEMRIGSGREPFTAIVGPENMDATPIILWDTEEQRNPYSWYVYNGGSYASSWNLHDGVFVDVTGIALQPNMWQEGYESQGRSVIFLLKDCKDTRNPKACLFPELLRKELREVRATIEAYSNENYLSGYEEASACGIRLQDGMSWNCTLRVTTDVGVMKYKLDRWD